MVETRIQLHSCVRAASFSIRQSRPSRMDTLGMPGDWALEREEAALSNIKCQAAYLQQRWQMADNPLAGQ